MIILLSEVVRVLEEFKEVVREFRMRQTREAHRKLSAVEAKAEEQRLRREYACARDRRLAVAEQAKSKQLQDLISRGLANSSILDSARRSIDEAAKRDIEQWNNDLTEALELQAVRLAQHEISSTTGGDDQ